jgi:hypothetical protein
MTFKLSFLLCVVLSTIGTMFDQFKPIEYQVLSFPLCDVLSTICTMFDQLKPIEYQVLQMASMGDKSFENNGNWYFYDS